MLLLVTVFTAQAQNTPQTLTVNDGTTAKYSIPFYSYYSYSSYQQSQFVIPDYDITEMAGKTIDGLTFYLNQPAATACNAVYKVFMKPYDSETISSMQSYDNSNVVYTGTLDNSQDEMVITFDKPYDYDGGHLLIGFHVYQTATVYGYSYFYGVDKRDASISRRSNSNVYQENFLPKTTFTYHEETEAYIVTAVADPEEGGTVTGGGEFLVGRPCTLVATPNEHYHFVNWTKGEDIVSTNASYTFNVTEDVELTANFALDQFQINAEILPSLGGTVEGTGTYNYGETCTLTAVPDEDNGYHFVDWNYMAQQYSIETEITFTVEQNMTFYATFSLNEYAITATANPATGGVIEGAGVYEYGDQCTLTAQTTVHYNFINWTKGDEVVTTDQSFSFTVTENEEYVANFEQYLFLVDVEIEGDEDAEVTGWGYFEEGTEVTLTATPSSYLYYFVEWQDAEGETLSENTAYTFEIGAEDVTLKAIFGSHIIIDGEVTVHDGGDVHSYVPFYGYYTDAPQRNQMIYPASDLEIFVGKEFNEMTFYFDYGENYNYGDGNGDWIISIGETEATVLNAIDDETELTEVYSGGFDDLYNHTNHTLKISFDTPYSYNGGNLLVEFNHPVAASYKDYVFYGEEVEGASFTGCTNYVYPDIKAPQQRDFLPKTTFRNVEIEPIVSIAPEEIVLPGLRPNGAWLEDDNDYFVMVTNLGGPITINSITMTNPYFTTDLELPAVVGMTSVLEIHVLRGGNGDGEETGEMIINYGDDEEFTVALSANAYEPVAGDVWETAIEVEFENDNYEHQLPVEDLLANYNLPVNHGIDAVYKVVLPQERKLTVTTTAINASAYIYQEDFNEVGGPSYYNTYYYNGPTFVEQRGNRDNNDFLNETFDGDEMPEGWSQYAEWGMNEWVLDTDNHYVKCEHNINAGQSWQGNTWLVSPKMDLSNETNVRVTLNYMNKKWDNDIDIFGVYFRNNEGGWQQLLYTEEAHETMTEVVINLDYLNYYMGTEFQLGFLMYDRFGHGVVIDDVTVTGYRMPIDVITNAYLPAGTYYVAISTDDTDFMEVGMHTSMVDVPEMSYINYPAYYENVPLDAEVTYNLGWFTEEMQILIGVTNPPTDTLINWTAPVETVQLQNVEYNKKYYIQLNGRNAAGTTYGSIYYFQTIREGAENFLVDNTQAFYGNSDTLTFTWDAPEDALGYKLFYGKYYDYGDWGYWGWYNQIGDVITTTEYQVAVDDLLSYNMDGYDFAVRTVYKYGDSEFSDRQTVYVSGNGYVWGYIFEQDGIVAIEGATIVMDGADEFDNPVMYEFTSDETGYFTSNSVKAGEYTLTATKEGYQPVSHDLTITYNNWNGVEFWLTEEYYPVSDVVAVEEDSDAVITWQYQNTDRSLQGFNVYRTSAYNDGPYTTDNTELVADGVTELTYADETWANLEVGSYKYGVAAVYAGNAPTDRGNRDVETHTIYEEDANTNYNVPAYALYYDEYTRSQHVIPAEEISVMAGGTITELTYYFDETNGGSNNFQHPLPWTTNVQVKYYMKEVDYTTISAYESVDNCTVVYTGYVTYNTDGTAVITLDTPFEYNGGNLLVGSENITTGQWNGINYYGKTANGASIGYHNTSSTASVAATQQNFIPKTTFTYETGGAPISGDNMSEIVWSNPLDVNMEIENGVSVTVELNNGESPEGVEVVLTNVNDPSKVYEVTLDETGFYMWETFYKGTYDVSVSFNDDYSTASAQIEIMSPINLTCTLRYIVPLAATMTVEPEGYATAYVYWVENNNWYASTSHNYLYGDYAALYSWSNDSKEFMFYSNADTLVSRNVEYYYYVTDAADYVAHYRTPGSYYNVENPLAFENTMSFIGIIQIDGETQNDLELEVGAFVGDECRGGARLDFYEQIQGYRLFMTVYGEDNEELTFRLYNHANGEEFDLRCATTELFAADAVLGTAAEPYVFNFRNTVIQTVELAEGWNWWSTYLEQNNFEGLATFEAGLGTNGVSIVSQSSGFVTYDEEYDEWSGNLAAINNEEMFKVNLTADVNFDMENYQADPANHEITLYNGWTYLGFISMQPMSIEEAFAGFEPADGDMVKAQEGFATYDAEYAEWSGSLNTLTPGTGLMYMSNNEDDVTFTYPAVVRGEMIDNVTSEHWTANYHAYPKNMTVTAVVELNDDELAGGDYELAAFANDECRGSVKLINAGAANRYYAFLTVTGNTTAELRFALYDAATGMETFDSTERLIFSSDAMVGDMRNPFVVSFRGTTGLDEFSSNITLYPNPANKGDRVRIEMSGYETAQIEIVNSLGQVVSAETTQMPTYLQIPEEAGVYTVRVITEGKNIKCQKLIVK